MAVNTANSKQDTALGENPWWMPASRICADYWRHWRSLISPQFGSFLRIGLEFQGEILYTYVVIIYVYWY